MKNSTKSRATRGKATTHQRRVPGSSRLLPAGAARSSPHMASKPGHVHRGRPSQRIARPVRKGRPGSGQAEGMAQDRREDGYKRQTGSVFLTPAQKRRSAVKLAHQLAQARRRQPEILRLQQKASQAVRIQAASAVTALPRPKWAARARESLLGKKDGTPRPRQGVHVSETDGL